MRIKLARELVQTPFYFTLDSGLAGLELESRVIGSIVLNYQGQPSVHVTVELVYGLCLSGNVSGHVAAWGFLFQVALLD